MLLPSNKLLLANGFKLLAILILFSYIIYIFLANYHSCFYKTAILTTTIRPKWPFTYTKSPSLNTNISHIIFGIAATSNSWTRRKPYIEAWWQPNVTRGYVFLDRPPKQPWPSTSPPYRVSEDTSRYNAFNRHKNRHVVRLVHVISEMFNAENGSDVRWYVMGDDDTVFFVDNLVEVLEKYDYEKYYYIGMNSECVDSNALHSFEMAFGGGGYVFSYPLAKALAKNIDVCIKTYPTLFGSDHVLQSCVADLGISLTREKGFHQIDLHQDISGFLSAHPQSPLVSLHHIDAIQPIFPSMNHFESIHHLMKAAKADESRLVQQTICYHKNKNWTFSISWGYSTHIYEAIYPPSILQMPLETFVTWRRRTYPPYMFKTRFSSTSPCEAPHVFFLSSIEEVVGNNIITIYSRTSSRKLPICSSSGNHSADHINKILVISPMMRHNEEGSRRECCDINVETKGSSSIMLKLRPCTEDEMVP